MFRLRYLAFAKAVIAAVPCSVCTHLLPFSSPLPPCVPFRDCRFVRDDLSAFRVDVVLEFLAAKQHKPKVLFICMDEYQEVYRAEESGRVKVSHMHDMIDSLGACFVGSPSGASERLRDE